jgi:hypothetical protein
LVLSGRVAAIVQNTPCDVEIAQSRYNFSVKAQRPLDVQSPSVPYPASWGFSFWRPFGVWVT